MRWRCADRGVGQRCRPCCASNTNFNKWPNSVLALPTDPRFATSATVFDRRFRLPAVQQGSLTLEREVGAAIVASATYLMNLDRQLPNSVDINIAPATATKTFQLQGGTGTVGVQDGEIFVVPFYSQRLNTSFGPVTAIVSNADASYNAVVLEARRRLRRALEFRTSWTWSKATAAPWRAMKARARRRCCATSPRSVARSTRSTVAG